MDWEKYDYTKKCTVSGWVPADVFVNPCDCECYLDIRKAVNFSDITEDIENINGCCVRFISDSAFYIFQIGGYSFERGLFCDLM